MTLQYSENAPDRRAVDELPGATVIEFGTGWCGHCKAAQPLLATVFSQYPAVRHLKVEDGPGRALGRAFRVKLWPTLVFLRDGEEVARLVRPGAVSLIEEAFEQMTGQG
ncbi:thioredoxin family protein [Pseudomonas sp.]|uniref:thioredoxin family protein n=1 Tax=Pseudomonas sp. TaxID=306 RepID=UPI003CC6B2C2